jgi:hypothetical protein
MHEAQAIATFVLTAGLALLVLAALVVFVVVAVVSVRVAGAVQAAVRDGARTMRALAQTTQALSRMTQRAERGVRQLRRSLSRISLLENLMGGRKASIMMAILTAIEGAGAAFQAFSAVRRQRAEASGEAPSGDTGGGEGTAHVG